MSNQLIIFVNGNSVLIENIISKPYIIKDVLHVLAFVVTEIATRRRIKKETSLKKGFFFPSFRVGRLLLPYLTSH